MEHKQVTAYELNVGDTVEYLGVVDTVLEHKIIPLGEYFEGEVQMKLNNGGEGIFDKEEFILLSTTTTDQYTRILEALSDAETIATAKRIYEALQ